MSTDLMPHVVGPPKTSSQRPSTPPSASAQDGIEASQSRTPSTSRSPAFSTSSTVDGSGDQQSSSPIIPSLPAPRLPERAQEHLRRTTTPQSRAESDVDDDNDDDDNYVTTSWGSPYPHSEGRHLRQESSSSEASEDSPIHRLAIQTPFLRSVPQILWPDQEHHQSSQLSESAAVLVNRVRRPIRSITEDWIRAHTTHDPASEQRHWLSDGDYSEHSSLSGSVSSDEAGWLDETEPRTPRASFAPTQLHRTFHGYSSTHSSNETLRGATLNLVNENMDNLNVRMGRVAQDAASIHTIESAVSETASKIETPKLDRKASLNGSTRDAQFPATPSKPMKPTSAHTPRLKKKVPWKGKSIVVHLPRDDERWKGGAKGPKSLSSKDIEAMFKSWEELGYNTRGFDLDAPRGNLDPLEFSSQSRNEWPNLGDIARERSQRKYKVMLPDLNAWKNYVNEIAEAKLRALGVSFGDEDPAPSISPAPSNLSRQTSNQYPPLPFSPPLPTPSAGSAGHQGFPFPGGFQPTSGAQSPALPSPAPFHNIHHKYNPRASISISPHELPFQFPGQPSPHGWSPQMLLHNQHLGRSRSPSVMNMSSVVSPTSPFQHDNIPSPLGMHNRHQSLQFPMLPHQFLPRQDSARPSPRLQELQEVDEEAQSNPYEGQNASKTPEPARFIKHNASASLQKEIDDAEYHLEEQFREQLEHEDYSPHNENQKAEAGNTAPAEVPQPSHSRGPSVHFGNFGTDSDEGPVLHHPQPHSRGHSLSQKAYVDNDETRDSTDEGSTKQLPPINTHKGDESYEIETNPSNMGTPIQALDLVNKLHQRDFSTTSNPWADAVSQNGVENSSRRPGHSSKPSLSSLNANAAEFKFNPGSSSFSPAGFNFGAPSFQPGASSFQPVSFHGSQASVNPPQSATSSQFNPPQSATSSHFSVAASTASAKNKITAAAPAFTPQRSEFSFPAKSDFNFSSSGPKFNPDAPTFQPFGSLAPSIASATASGYESGSNRPTSIFGKIDWSLSDVVQPPPKKSKAIPIVRPSSPAPAPVVSVETDPEEQAEGGRTDKGRRSKNFRDSGDDGNNVPLFAEPTPEPEFPIAQLRPAASKPENTAQDEIDEEEEEEDAAALGDTSMASTVLSESNDGKLQSETNDTKATTSPTATSPDHDKANWNPFEFSRQEDALDFANARPYDDEYPMFKKTHKKTLSAAAKPFTPGGFMFGAPNPTAPAFDPAFKTQPPPMVEPELSEDDRNASPTPMPEHRPATEAVPEPEEELRSPPSPQLSPRSVTRGGLGASRFAASPPPRQGLGTSRFASPPPRPAGLAASRFAKSPSPVSDEEAAEAPEAKGTDVGELHSFNDSIPMPVSPPSVAADDLVEDADHEPTFEEIDAVMQHLHDHDPTMGAHRSIESPKWHQPSPIRHIPLAGVTNASPVLLPPQQKPFRDNAPSPSPRQYRTLLAEPAEPARPMLSTEMDDPFVDGANSAATQSFDAGGPAVHHLNSRGSPQSDWEGDFSASEQEKLEQRVQFFDGHVNDVVDHVLASRLHPLEQALESIQRALVSRRTPSSRYDRRSASQEIQESDADDEDDEINVARRSLSPRRDKRMEQIRFAVLDAMKQHQVLQAPAVEQVEKSQTSDNSSIIKALSDMREQFEQSLHLDFRAEDLRNVVEEAVQKRMASTPPVVKGDEEATNKMLEMQTRIQQLEQRLYAEEEKVEKETTLRRGAEEEATKLRSYLNQAETKIDAEIMNRSVYDQRVHELEERLKIQEDKTELEIGGRREAEDRLSEIQRLLRISSEEEDRLRSVLEEKETKIKTVEEAAGKHIMRLHLLEAAQENGNQTQADLASRLNAAEEELRASRQEVRHWRSEAEHARESNRRQTDDLVQAIEESKHLRKLIDTMSTQVHEYERTRESWRAKYASLQDDVAHTVREMTEENMRHTKKEQALLARHEVLDARLQAESRTRERLETELERLEAGERAALRAVAECNRLEKLVMELRNENHNVHQNAMRIKREAQEAKETAAAEVQRAQITVQAELEAANEQVNAVRAELEGELAVMRAELAQAKTGVDTAQQEIMLEEETNKLRAQLDQVKLDADTAKAHHEMMLEEATNSKETALQELMRKHQNEVEDLKTRYERQVNNTTEDAQRTEQHLLERLSLSTSKVEHLQDRVSHLEDKVQIAQEAARAAAQAAKAAGANEPAAYAAAAGKPAVSQAMQLPEKISPQALRESIMVLQEQLQAREQRIEELEQTVSKLDPEAATKITKRDDEITWLRELLAVRHSDLQDIIGALSSGSLDREAVRDAAIRLKAGLQMEEQERERAMNGGSAINLPNIAATIQAATPRVAQAVGPLAAAWGNWRKGNTPSLNNVPSVRRSSAAPARNSTPSKSTIASPGSQSGFLSGLMTPPASSLRSTPFTEPSKAQPTAFGSTGRRFTAEQFAQRSRESTMTARQAEKMPLAVSTPGHMSDLEGPVTPTMARSNGYDADANRITDDFDDAGFFDD